MDTRLSVGDAQNKGLGTGRPSEAGACYHPPSWLANKPVMDWMVCYPSLARPSLPSISFSLPDPEPASGLFWGVPSDLAFPPCQVPFRVALQPLHGGIPCAPASSFIPRVWQLVAVNYNKMPFQKNEGM